MFAILGIGLLALAVFRLAPKTESPALVQATPVKQPESGLATTVEGQTAQETPAVSPDVKEAVAPRHSGAGFRSDPMAPLGEQKLLVQVLNELADYKCPATILTSYVLAACRSQMPQLGDNIRLRGRIRSVSFVGPQSTISGTNGVYTVKFVNSEMIWVLSRSSDGKLKTISTSQL